MGRRRPTKAELRRWKKLADTINAKVSVLFDAIEDVVGMDDLDLIPLVGDTLVSSHELNGALEARLDPSLGTLPEDRPHD